MSRSAELAKARLLAKKRALGGNPAVSSSAPPEGFLPFAAATSKVHPVLLKRIRDESDYFRLISKHVTTFEQFVNEAYESASHTGAYDATGKPSKLWCLVVRGFSLGLSEKQLKMICTHQDSAYIRCVGLLMLRLGLADLNENSVRAWFGDAMFDETLVSTGNQKSKNPPVCLGVWVAHHLLTNNTKYDSTTTLPRLPTKAFKAIEKIVEKIERTIAQLSSKPFPIGTKLRAKYTKDDLWYDAELLEVDDVSGTFKVKYTEYGNEEKLTMERLRVVDAERRPAKRLKTT